MRIRKKNKKGWIKVIEVFIAIMLMTGAVVLVLNQNSFTGDVIGKEINQKMDYILKTIQNDEDLREEILDASLPVEWDDFNSSGLTNTGLKVLEKSPRSIICESKVCDLNDDCTNPGSPPEKNIYSKSGYISADLDTYAPRQLKLFCWVR